MKEKIMHLWEDRIRKNVESASAKTTPVLRKMLPELLDNLVSNISPAAKESSYKRAAEIGKEHGEQRAGLIDYTFSQVLSEYRILRQVIFEVLEEEKLQVSEVRDIILDVLDEGIQKAIEEFSYIRSEELKRSNRDLEHFASIAAHDLKSPLTTITGFAELLERNFSSKVEIEDLEYIQTIKRSAARMTLLIDRLLEYSLTGRDLKSFEPVALGQVLHDVEENLKPAISGTSAKIYCEKLPTVLGERSLLSQLFQNFISNALKFRDSERTPEIYIDVRSHDVEWIFSIKDNGIGFDPKDKENIFSLFKRLHSEDYLGAGIGLATARKVVEIHGGKIWAESTLGVGSTFFFTLPKSENTSV